MKTLIITVLLISACNVQPEKIKVSEKSDSMDKVKIELDNRRDALQRLYELQKMHLDYLRLYETNNPAKADSVQIQLYSINKKIDSISKL